MARALDKQGSDGEWGKVGQREEEKSIARRHGSVHYSGKVYHSTDLDEDTTIQIAGSPRLYISVRRITEITSVQVRKAGAAGKEGEDKRSAGAPGRARI